MQRWVLSTDEAEPAHKETIEFRGQRAAADLPAPDEFVVGEWIEIVISKADPRIVWRLQCAEVD